MNFTRTIRIALTDDHCLFLRGLEMLLSEGSLKVVGTANNGKELLGLLAGQEVDLVLLDINMPFCSGLDVAPEIKKRFPRTKLMFLSSYHVHHLIERAKAAGADAYLLKTSSKEELVCAIAKVMAGESQFPKEEESKMTPVSEQELFFKQFNITRRELEIIHLIREGFSSPQIAERLFLSVLTVDTHRKHIMQKLGLKKAASLISFLAKHNL